MTTPRTHLTLTRLSGGTLRIPTKYIVKSGTDEEREYPDWAYLVEHPSGMVGLWDLGLDQDLGMYPPPVQEKFETFRPTPPEKALHEQFPTHVKPEHISFIIFSHAHWDHLHTPNTSIFTHPNLKLWVGPGTKKAVGKGWPEDGKSTFPGKLFQEKVEEIELRDDEVKFGRFGRTYDLFGDGSLVVAGAPGHMPGNLCALACTSASSPDSSATFTLLAGDCAHDKRLITGEEEPAEWREEEGGEMTSMYKDLGAARVTWGMIREVLEGGDGRVELGLAHDWGKE
ncbi:hypothetical protein SAICODRAFT_204264 [Saitoella complicata NRRL Y-17804]|uniref:Metallo-beta-lactamase domain-containing protein n=1 Tax=Saitoella complicata (strain BCRC 22490 / CBS 7301 / JCM 7358 / NBRC 10748 / NRRL Y-17804) TaxID=698492 RepID=A0A0E9NRN5_SAICN|nr:uncharacterized protein SAICODRAFT_204264 [Saitoella complicata NRRL Y-17804]ODQ54727.1 hypothetical protein SAICODRAFT_204264 [Saitoella complicata NRRL Y-17804]GAO52527.1 hypothetical protein G7K_6601-t1 [Saitoella complicata NRRL Y-17804]